VHVCVRVCVCAIIICVCSECSDRSAKNRVTEDAQEVANLEHFCKGFLLALSDLRDVPPSLSQTHEQESEELIAEVAHEMQDLTDTVSRQYVACTKHMLS
jgi:hypothetical protein